jgi:hypothetical protein
LDNYFDCEWRSIHRYLRLNSDGTYEKGYWEEKCVELGAKLINVRKI